jgi:hypothetical protein
MVLSFGFPWASLLFSVWATVKLITVLPFTLLVTASFPKWPMACILTMMNNFGKYQKKAAIAVKYFYPIYKNIVDSFSSTIPRLKPAV